MKVDDDIVEVVLERKYIPPYNAAIDVNVDDDSVYVVEIRVNIPP